MLDIEKRVESGLTQEETENRIIKHFSGITNENVEISLNGAVIFVKSLAGFRLADLHKILSEGSSKGHISFKSKMTNEGDEFEIYCSSDFIERFETEVLALQTRLRVGSTSAKNAQA